MKLGMNEYRNILNYVNLYFKFNKSMQTYDNVLLSVTSVQNPQTGKERRRQGQEPN